MIYTKNNTFNKNDVLFFILFSILFSGQKNALTQETELLESILQEVEHQVIKQFYKQGISITEVLTKNEWSKIKESWCKQKI